MFSMNSNPSMNEVQVMSTLLDIPFIEVVKWFVLYIYFHFLIFLLLYVAFSEKEMKLNFKS